MAHSKHPLPRDVARLPRGAWLRSEPWATEELRQLVVSWAASLRAERGWARYEIEETTTDRAISRRSPPGVWSLAEGPRTLEDGWRADKGEAVLVARFWPVDAASPFEVSTMFPRGARTTLAEAGERITQLESSL